MIGAHAIPPPLLAFWRDVENLVQTLFSLFGGPDLLMQRRTLTREDHRLLTRWLQAAEAFLRRLILIEAAGTPVMLKPIRKAKKRLASRKPETIFDPDQPESWRVSFRMSFAQGARDAGKTTKPKRFHDATPLAKRFEALLRAYNDPRAIIARLAKRLKRDLFSVSERLFAEKTHASVGVQDRFDEAGLLLESALRSNCNSS